MATTAFPSAFAKERETLFAKLAKANETAAELKHHQTNIGAAHPGIESAAEQWLATCRDDVDRWLGVLLDGEGSIENSWRNFCADHLLKAPGDSGDERARAIELFEQHLALLKGMDDAQPFCSALAEVGFPLRRLHDVSLAIERTEEIREQVLERWPLTEREFAYVFPVDAEEVVYITPMAFLRSMVTIIWNAFRHPFSTTYIDLSTGNCVTPLDGDA